MKILYWADGFWPRIGGRETQGLQFVLGMQERGHECIVFAERDHPSLQEQERFQGVSVERFEFRLLLQNIKMVRSLHERLEKIKREFAPDILYLNTLENGSAFAFLLFSKIFQVKSVLTIHTPYYKEAMCSISQKICQEVDYVSSPSKWGFEVMQKLLPPLKNPLKRIDYGLFMPKLAPSPLPFSPPTILFLGRLSEEKGVDRAIFAFDLLKKRGLFVKALIAGEGPLRSSLEQLVSSLGLEDRVTFMGALLRDEDAVFSSINQATFVVLPSLQEAFGLVALEAMQMGRPVVGSDIGGIPEIIEHKERGLLVKNSSEHLCEAMEFLITHREETIRMGKNAHEWAKKNYLLEENLDQYEELFKACL